jgi:hypothetical protein
MVEQPRQVTRNIEVVDDAIAVERIEIAFHRTLRIPDDGRTYPLPPGLGRFPLRRACDFAEHLPRPWENDFFLPIYAREALWIGFDAAPWKPNAVKVGAGGVNVVTGERFDKSLHDEPQDYIVCPDQPWIDGVKSHANAIRQFVAMPHGEGYTIEAQITGREETGGLQFIIFEPKEGLFADRAPTPAAPQSAFAMSPVLGAALGGTMQQKIYPDRFGIDTWDPESALEISVHFLQPAVFSAITGEPLPDTPVDARAYTDAGLPWFDLYDDAKSDLDAADALKQLKSIVEIDDSGPEESISVPKRQRKRLRFDS